MSRCYKRYPERPYVDICKAVYTFSKSKPFTDLNPIVLLTKTQIFIKYTITIHMRQTPDQNAFKSRHISNTYTIKIHLTDIPVCQTE